MKRWTRSFSKGYKSSKMEREVTTGFIDFDLIVSIKFKNNGKYYVQGFSNEGDDYTMGTIWVCFEIDPSFLPKMWSTVYFDLVDVMRHELEHLTQAGYNAMSNKYFDDDTLYRSMINDGFMPSYLYLLLPKEIDANLQGLSLKAKKKKQSLQETIKQYLDVEDINDDESKIILAAWRKRALKIGGISKF